MVRARPAASGYARSLMLRSPYDRDILALALPALVALAADPLVSVVDTAWVTRVGGDELAALGASTGLFALAFFVFNFLAYGTTPLVAGVLHDRARVGRVVGRALTLAVLLGALAAAVLAGVPELLVGWMGATGSVAEQAVAYVRVRALAAPAVLILTAANGAYRGVQDTRTPLKIALVLSAVNLVLDPMLIFGAGWGLVGAAVATVVAQWAGALLALAALLGVHRERFAVPWRVPRPRELVPLLSAGSLLSVRTFALVGTLTVATAVAARVGPDAIGAHQVAWQLWIVAAFVVDSLAVAGQALVGRALGEGDPARARAIGRRLLTLGVGVGLALSVGLAALTPVLPWLLAETPLAARQLLGIWWVVVLMQPVNAAIFVWDGLYMGARRFSFAAVSMVVASVAGLGVLALVGPMGWGLGGVWAALVVLQTVRVLTLAVGQVERPRRAGLGLA